jgi:hypothetical protein
MILSAMGPVSPLTTPAGKLFASACAMLSGLLFICMIGIVLAPLAHRIFHILHLDEESDQLA